VSIIEVRNVRRSFRSTRKEEGMKVLLFILLSLCYAFGQRTATCEDATIQGSCFDCFTKGPLGTCGYCVPITGSSGCFTLNPSNKMPMNTAICARTQVTPGDRWLPTPDGCSDSCFGDNNKQNCPSCIGDTICGWCTNTGSCRRANGNGTAPWNDYFPCTDFRFLGSKPTALKNDICISYKNCNNVQSCSLCATNKQSATQSCSWCGSVTSLDGKCIVAGGNETCTDGTSLIEAERCLVPKGDAAMLSAVLMNVIVLAFLAMSM